MTLEELNLFASQVKAHAASAQRIDGSIEKIASIRKGEVFLWDIFGAYGIRYDQSAEDAVRVVMSQVRDDVLRIAEMRLEADARKHRAAARAAQSALGMYVQDKPEGKEA